jgi:transcriptional activator SPT7
LGLAEEFGLENLSVPLHLLQNRMHSAYQAQHQGPTNPSGLVFPLPEPYEPVTHEVLNNQIGLVQDFFRSKMKGDGPLIEDEELPAKQRFPKPRLPPTGKISSPRKRPLREQQQAAKKKRKLEENERNGVVQPVGKLKLEVPAKENEAPEPEKRKGGNGANGNTNGETADAPMISPESMS